MCFSPEADLVAGAAVSVVGIDALRHVREPREYPLASLPLLLGAHLLVEAVVWWGESDRVPEIVGEVAVWLYLVIALAVLPILVPGAVWAVESDQRRRRLMTPLVIVGAGVAALFAARIVTGPLGAAIVDGCCISYDTGPGYHWSLSALYVAATCLPMLVSGHRPLVVFGVVNLTAVGLLVWLVVDGLASLWCAWAAVTSVLIAAHLRHRRPEAGGRVSVARASRGLRSTGAIDD